MYCGRHCLHLQLLMTRCQNLHHHVCGRATETNKQKQRNAKIITEIERERENTSFWRNGTPCVGEIEKKNHTTNGNALFDDIRDDVKLAQLSFPRKMTEHQKMFAQGSIRQTIGRTAVLSYPNRREPSVHHKEGRSTAATSHESQPVKPSFCISAPPQKSPHPEVRQITRYTGLGELLG